MFELNFLKPIRNMRQCDLPVPCDVHCLSFANVRAVNGDYSSVVRAGEGHHCFWGVTRGNIFERFLLVENQHLDYISYQFADFMYAGMRQFLNNT